MRGGEDAGSGAWREAGRGLASRVGHSLESMEPRLVSSLLLRGRRLRYGGRYDGPGLGDVTAWHLPRKFILATEAEFREGSGKVRVFCA